MKRLRIEHGDKYIAIHSRRNHAEFAFGKGKRHGFLIGTNWYENFDWWHLEFGITVLFWFVGLKFRWRVFGCQYNRRDKDDFYI